ncbi:CopD family protein [Nocardia sp. NPDC050697]|uniref:copper resistance D family protein n=1 Tax=Nocardia sp. NPDC050697 TaxID=3155158 RepID=UPI0033EC4EDD
MKPPATAGRRVLWLLLVAGLLGVGVAWLLSGATPAEGPIRVLADGLGASALGLAALPRLAERLRVPWRLLATIAGSWCAAEFALLVFEAAEVVDTPVGELGLGSFGAFVRDTSGGQVGVAVLAVTALIAVYGAYAFRTGDGSPDLVLVFAAVALALRPITGHMSQQVFGSVLAAAHALAAGLWFGLLVALALVLRGRGEWAAALPRYSALAGVLIAVVAATGVLNGLIRLGGVGGLLDTGYGRIMLAKTAVLLALAGLGWWWRRGWVPRAAGHRVRAENSLRRAVTETLIMALAFGLAATLAVTA